MTTHFFKRRTVLGALTLGTAAATLASHRPATAAPMARELRAGMSGPDVTELQIRVAGWAADEPRQTFLPISGVFDTATEAALRRFQTGYGLSPTGIADPSTLDALAALTAADGSTVHFGWPLFASPESGDFTGGKADPAAVREHTRRLMYKLEALRHKLGGRDVGVTKGFHSAVLQARLRGATDSRHTLGDSADVTVAGLSTYTVYRTAQTCGFSGLGSFTQSWLHCDSRAEVSAGTAWSWASGVLTAT